MYRFFWFPRQVVIPVDNDFFFYFSCYFYRNEYDVQHTSQSSKSVFFFRIIMRYALHHTDLLIR